MFQELLLGRRGTDLQYGSEVHQLKFCSNCSFQTTHQSHWFYCPSHYCCNLKFFLYLMKRWWLLFWSLLFHRYINIWYFLVNLAQFVQNSSSNVKLVINKTVCPTDKLRDLQGRMRQIISVEVRSEDLNSLLPPNWKFHLGKDNVREREALTGGGLGCGGEISPVVTVRLVSSSQATQGRQAVILLLKQI